MSIESFGAVVGDNDGAAFITKAEFESLKNDFQTQINRYNTSLDSKIDGAIATYLAGVTVAKTYEIKPYVQNYTDMWWVNEYKIYGKWRKWTSKTEKTEKTTNEWFIPSLNEKRLLTRDNGGTIDFYDYFYSADGVGTLQFVLTILSNKNGLSTGKRNYGADNTSASFPPVAFVRLNYNDADRLYYPDTTDPLYNQNCLMNVQHFKPHSAGISYETRGDSLHFAYGESDILSFRTPTGAQVYYCDFKYQRGDNASQNGYSIPTFTSFMFPYVWNSCSLFNATNETEIGLNSAGDGGGNGTTDATYYARGVTFHAGDSATETEQETYFLRMMLGTSSNAKINAGYIASNGPQTYDFSSAEDSGQLSVRVKYANLSQPRFKDTSTDEARNVVCYIPTSNIDFTLNLPLWPTLKLQDINSNYYRYNNLPLTKGAGLPIAINVVANGDLHVSAKYETARIVSTYSTKGISVDIANDTFTSPNWEYVDGYVGDNDADIKKLKHIVFNNSEKSLSFTIPVKKEDNVWLRIAPDTSDGGYYAKLKDLKVTLETY